MLLTLSLAQLLSFRPFFIACRHNLQPMVTLHHFVHPTWFEKLGGFTREANIPHFVAFAQTAFR